MAVSKIYSVKGGNFGKLNNLENKVFEFMTSDEFLKVVKVGDSLSEKQLKKQFASWNKDRMTVNVATLINERNCRKIALMFVYGVKTGQIESKVIPVVSSNETHGNFAIDFKSIETIDSEYTEKELTIKGKKEKTVFEFLESYLSKESVQIAIDMTEGKNDKINAIISILEELKN